MTQVEQSIYECYVVCMLALEELVTNIQQSTDSTTVEVSLEEIRHESERYELWARNHGASQKKYTKSLDYRLRDSSFYRTRVSSRALCFVMLS